MAFGCCKFAYFGQFICTFYIELFLGFNGSLCEQINFSFYKRSSSVVKFVIVVI